MKSTATRKSRTAGTIAALGAYASLERSDVAVPMIATPDIAAVVARELLEPRHRGVLHLHAPRHYTFQQVASVFGRGEYLNENMLW